MKPEFKAGSNIAIKIPPHEYEATVQFYSEVLGLPRLSDHDPEIVFDFDGKNLWLDRV